MVEVRLLAITPEPERVICTCARNDYFQDRIPDHGFETIMEKVGGDTLEGKMRTLLGKLMLRGHWGVFEHAQMTLWFRVSRACMAQITRHRHVSFDIQSQRYVNFKDVDPTDPDDILWPRTWDADEVVSREGKTPIELPAERRKELITEAYTKAVDAYNEMVEAGMPKEDARMLLPIGTKVNITASMNMRTAFHIVSMRGAGDAQAEIRQLAQGIEDVMREHLPIAMDVWDKKQNAIERQRLSP